MRSPSNLMPLAPCRAQRGRMARHLGGFIAYQLLLEPERPSLGCCSQREGDPLGRNHPSSGWLVNRALTHQRCGLGLRPGSSTPMISTLREKPLLTPSTHVGHHGWRQAHGGFAERRLPLAPQRGQSIVLADNKPIAEDAAAATPWATFDRHGQSLKVTGHRCRGWGSALLPMREHG